MKLLTLSLISVVVGVCCCYGFEFTPQMRSKIASSIAKGERRAQERRASRRMLCERCNRPPVQCLCASLPKKRIQTDTDVLVLQHPGEFRRKTFSTVPLLPLVLQNVKVCVGHSFDPEQVAPIRDAIARGQRLLLLFPGPDALSLDKPPSELMEGEAQQEFLNPTTFKDDKRNMLILIDGTWTQARKMARYSPSLLECCQQVQFTSQSSSIYDAVRREPEGHCLSTLEACAQALSLLEPDNDETMEATHHLHAALRSLVEIQLRHTQQNLPRYVNRNNKSEKKKRRLELEKELFGDNANGVTISTTLSIKLLEPQVVDIGNGATLRPLRSSDADFVDGRWPYRSKKSLAMIRRQIEADIASCCLGIEQDGKLCASIIRYQNGALGMLHVDEKYRRCGFGSALLKAATGAIEQRGESCFCFIMDGNHASEALFAKHGWVCADPDAKKGTGKRRAKRKWVKETEAAV